MTVVGEKVEFEEAGWNCGVDLDGGGSEHCPGSGWVPNRR